MSIEITNNTNNDYYLLQVNQLLQWVKLVDNDKAVLFSLGFLCLY